jgi:hypothetical protein
MAAVRAWLNKIKGLAVNWFATQRKGKNMTPVEIVALIGLGKPKLLENVPEDQAARLIREAFVLISKEIEAVEEGVVKVPGLGAFRIRQLEQEKEGEKRKLRKVVFQAAKAKKAKLAASGSRGKGA